MTEQERTTDKQKDSCRKREKRRMKSDTVKEIDQKKDFARKVAKKDKMTEQERTIDKQKNSCRKREKKKDEIGHSKGNRSEERLCKKKKNKQRQNRQKICKTLLLTKTPMNKSEITAQIQKMKLRKTFLKKPARN
ncbi:uncharacterized protein [Haliotis cracherodii]|uniref:uncharacterized protein n=1 Tax=Haliotis cracherodii TaxID=6455 RepID=UPI0039E78CAC